jgi:AcrR family transcriptional regulator
MKAINANTAVSDEKNALNRLLDAAEKLFCEQGFDRTSVRDLTTEAKCNVAAVNYHFGGKQGLYTEMFRRQVGVVVDDCIEVIDQVMSSPSPSLEDLIRGWVTPPLKALEQNEPRARVLQLMVREVLNRHIDPELIMKDLKDVFVRRMSEAFLKLEPDLHPKDAQLAVFSMDALLLHPLLFMPYYLSWIQGLDSDGIINHIVRFGTAAIRGYQRKES